MEFKEHIEVGRIRQETFLVEEIHTAYHIGSGDEKVLSTPSMISFMEQVSNRLISDVLPEDDMSVGIQVDIKHLAPTPVNTQIRVQVEVIKIEKKRILLKVEAWDSVDKIGEGTHRRAIVDKAIFMARVKMKSSV